MQYLYNIKPFVLLTDKRIRENYGVVTLGQSQNSQCETVESTKYRQNLDKIL